MRKRKIKKILNELIDVDKNISIKKMYGICPLEIISILLKYGSTKI